MRIQLGISLCIMLLAFCANAQTEKGSFLLDKTFSYKHEELENGFTKNYLRGGAGVGFFLRDNFVVGAKGDYGLTLYIGHMIANLGLSPYMRYYVDLKNERFKVFLEASLGMNQHLYVIEVAANAPSQTFVKAAAGPGVAYFINDNFAISSRLEYRYIRLLGFVGSSHNVSANFGFQLYLRSKNEKE